MPWLELSIAHQRRDADRVERALTNLGALSITLVDAGEQPILEPKPGETPLWRELHALALFPTGADRRGLVQVLYELLPWLAPEQLAFREVADSDWTRAWMDLFHPMRFGRRLWIYPSTVEPPADPDLVVVRLDPGLAFGTGTHATTALCLEWLDGLDLAGRTVLDVGCGSGVLAIAALKLGARAAHGVDLDPQALLASRDNAQANGVSDELGLAAALDGSARFDVVVANILAGALEELAPAICAALQPGAALALSGILEAQAGEVMACYEPWCRELSTRTRDGWVLVSGIRRAAAELPPPESPR
jgi:ribosomal protein L11 methyltransferase